ncbi:MAG: methyl-accepting chemotaxis protein [Campylobacterales bacterium]|nr:methyl-accepting chemotaxis protein [Campylobacterales bacterium]
MLNLSNMSTKGKLYFLTVSLLVGLGVASTISYMATQNFIRLSAQMYDDSVIGLQNSCNAGIAAQRMRFLSKVITDETLISTSRVSLEEVEDALKQEDKAFAAYEKIITADDDRQNFTATLQQREKFDHFIQKAMEMVRNGQIKEANAYVNANKELGKEYSKALSAITEWNTHHAKELNEQFDELAQSAITNIILILIFVVLFGLIAAYVIVRQIEQALSKIQTGLISFFRFINRETDKAELTNIDSKDEFGQIAIVMNDNIKKVEVNLITDKQFMDDVKAVMHRVENGWFSQHIQANTDNRGLIELKTIVNNALNNLRANFVTMNSLLEEYCNYDYRRELKIDNIERNGVFDTLTIDINKLRDAINTMLTTSLQNGIDLQADAGNLKQVVESLSTASNEQAASLEETAAAMEEMTSNVQNNAQKANDMASMAAQTDASAKEGAVLAQRTATAMTEIQIATNSINNAVSIIENIAFQTNILSLNAAVEAATAGDAGKGFAVVAQEVRNLANRSADAAKEIKAMAEQAAAKSNEGMNIATELTRGFEVIAGKIEQTTMLVQDVSNASREQMQGIGQINTAVTQLDQMTQENAKIAAEADSIANVTIDKAIAMVEDASSKNFVGKNEIQRGRMAAKPQQRSAPRASTFVSSKKSAPAKTAKHGNADVWESF